MHLEGNRRWVPLMLMQFSDRKKRTTTFQGLKVLYRNFSLRGLAYSTKF